MRSRITGLSSIVSGDVGLLTEILHCLLKCKERVLDPELVLEHVVNVMENGEIIIINYNEFFFITFASE